MNFLRCLLEIENSTFLSIIKMLRKKEKNMKKGKKEARQRQKQLMHLQILTNKILKMQQKDNGGLIKFPFFIFKKYLNR